MEWLQLLLVAALAGAGILFLFIKQRGNYAKQVQQLQPKKRTPVVEKDLRLFTREEVATHNTRDDAWIIVKDSSTNKHKVYDVTAYVDEHPGGESILNNVGRDATEGFLGPQHPATVFVLAEDFHIGYLDE